MCADFIQTCFLRKNNGEFMWIKLCYIATAAAADALAPAATNTLNNKLTIIANGLFATEKAHQIPHKPF